MGHQVVRSMKVGAVIAGCVALMATNGESALESGRYGVAGGSTVELCGGFTGECQRTRFAGDLSLEVFPAEGTAAIVGSDLRYEVPGVAGEWAPFPAADLVQLDQLIGTLEGLDAARFVALEGVNQEVDLLLTAAGDGLVLNGSYAEPCCDRYLFELTDVRMVPVRPPTPGDELLLLHDGRFEVTVSWVDATGRAGVGRVAGLDTDAGPEPVVSPESGVLWFFGPDNWEMTVKVLDGCAVNRHYWVFAAAATDVGYTLQVSDTATGERWEATHEVGTPAPAITDTTAFAGCP